MSAQIRETPVTMDVFINTKEALTTLLLEESGLMDTMQIGKVGELQDRKLKLTALLERYGQYLNKHPEVVGAMTAKEKSDLRVANDNFQKAITANYEKLMVARAINGAVVTCVKGFITKKNSNEIYNERGHMYNTFRAPISMTLNKVI